MNEPEIINKKMRLYFWLKFLGFLPIFIGMYLAIRNPLNQSPYFFFLILLGIFFVYVVFIFQRLKMTKIDPEYKSKVAAQRNTFQTGWAAILLGILIIFGNCTAPEGTWLGLSLGVVLMILGIFIRDRNRVALIIVSVIIGLMIILFILFKVFRMGFL
jgi:hypothetical protein